MNTFDGEQLGAILQALTKPPPPRCLTCSSIDVELHPDLDFLTCQMCGQNMTRLCVFEDQLQRMPTIGQG